MAYEVATDFTKFGAEDAELVRLLEEEEPNTDLLAKRLERLDHILERLPKIEADAIYLHYAKGKRQCDIAHIFGVTQAAVSYRLKRARKRLAFFLMVPPLTSEQIRDTLKDHFKSSDIDILVRLHETTCQSQVAHDLGISQGRVRHRFLYALQVLHIKRHKHPELEDAYVLFTMIGEQGLNLGREVVLPQWLDRRLNRLE